MTIFKANFNTRYSVSFSGSRASHDIYKWVATQRSLGTPGLANDVEAHHDRRASNKHFRFIIVLIN